MLVCIGVYWYILVDIGMYWYILVCICVYLVHISMYWYVFIVTDLRMALTTTERGGSYIQQRHG